MKILLIILMLSLSAFAFDNSSDNGKSISISKDKSFSEKESQDMKNSESKRESKSESKDESKSKSKDLTRIGQMQILKKIKELETLGIEPFNKCQILSNPKLLISFGITSQIDDFTVNTTKQSILEKAARNSSTLQSVGADEKKLKSYMKCIAYYGAIISQSLKTDTLDTEIEDEEILDVLEDFTKDIKQKECRFRTLEEIQCGGAKIKIDYEPILIYSNIPLFKDQTFFGYSLSSKNSISFSEKLSQDISRSKEVSKSTTKSQDFSASTREGMNTDKSSKTNLSVGKFLDIK